MNWMDKLERKWGRYAIPELHKYFVFALLLGLIINEIKPELLTYTMFSIPDILKGQVWRLVTWVVYPQSGGIFMILFMLCLIPMGRHLEHFIGTFRMNVYLIGGIIVSAISAILVYVVTALIFGTGFPVMLSAYYILLSIFMALAICMPDATVNLYFILPIKMKWMLVVYLLELGYELWQYFSMHWIFGVILGTQIIAALLNLFLFFYFSKIRVSRKHKKRQREFRAQMNTEPRPGSGITRHKCAICGRTEKDDPSLTFRYCSKCTGNKEYCNNHLFTHTHM